MSFNRGNQRNVFGNRNFNHGGGRGGGGGGGGGSLMGNAMGGSSMGNRGGRGGGGGGLNPWESGMMPGRGLLPTPNNNLNLNSPQAQLVIASNLLSNLLRSQQDNQPQVPSLLNMGGNLNGPGGNYPGQQNFARTYSERLMRNNMKNQRPQPYNKMGNNRAREAVPVRRGQTSQQSRAPQTVNQRNNGNPNQQRNDKTSKPISANKTNTNVKKEQQEVKSSDKEQPVTHVAKSDESEGGEEKKRDWKDEKREGEVIQKETHVNDDDKPAETQIEDGDNKSVTADKKTEDPQAGGKKSVSRHAESRYAAVPISLMFCHVCNKHMWDGFSFENHLRGRAHQLMMEKLDESYKLKVDLMRHELRVSEEQRELTLANSKRRGKKVAVDLNVREYCTMCDLNFFGTLSTHRKSDKHQQLKTFLHPRCFPCAKEFPSRIEYDEHCFTPIHMKSSAQNEEQRKNKKKDKLQKGESEIRTAEDEEKDSGTDVKTSDKEDDTSDDVDYVVDIPETFDDAVHKIPSVKQWRSKQLVVGKSMVKEVQGYHCAKCRRFMLTEVDMNAHLRTQTHYRNFVQELKALKSAATAATEAPAEDETAETEKPSSKDDDDDEAYEGDWKRRKIDDTSDKTSPKIDKDKPMDETMDVDETKKPDGDEKYDPLEADEETEDDESPEKTSKTIQTTRSTRSTTKDDTKDDKNTSAGPVEKMWAELDDDNDPDTGNLIDDDVEDREFRLDDSDAEEPAEIELKVEPKVDKVATVKPQDDKDAKKSKEPEKSKETEIIEETKIKNEKVDEKKPEKLKIVGTTKQTSAKKEEVAVTTTNATKVVEKTGNVQSPQAKSSPVVQTANSTPERSPATPRGRGGGYGRGGMRGTPRARRSRR